MRINGGRYPSSIWLAGLLAHSVAPLAASDSVAMRTIEGQVLSVGRYQGESGLEVLVANLEVHGGPEDGLQVLLAPESVCAQIGFQVEEGDRLRARVFVSTEGPSSVQKVQNFTRGTMVRLRTLHRTPLWNTTGSWQGGPLRTTAGRHRHGQSRGGGGPP